MVLAQAADLGLAGLDARGLGADLAGELGQALAAVGGGAGLALQACGLLGVAALGVGRGQRRRPRGRPWPRRSPRASERLLLADLGGLGAQLLGVAALTGRPPARRPALSRRTRSAASDPVEASRSRRRRSANQRPAPGPARARRPRPPASSVGEPAARGRRGRPRPRCGAAMRADSSATSCSSVEVSWTRSSASRRSRASRASAWMTAALRAASAWRPSGPSWRRISPVRSLTRVRLASIDSSLRSARLLALAVLEDAGGLLDEAAALLGGRAQHGVELALADDDVHLAADAGVGEQLLHVEQAAGGAVDGVLRAAVAEHRPRDRHLGVVDRQRAVGVVDRQGDLGAAQRRRGRTCRRR